MGKKLINSYIAELWIKYDSIDIPECFGSFSKREKVCRGYCGLAMKCCVLKGFHPGAELLDMILNQPEPSDKFH